MARPKEMLIDRRSIVTATIKLLERDGLDGFNLRALAQALSVNPASIYYYFDGKDAILRAAAGQILREVEVPPDHYEWKRWMVESAVNYWRLLVRKPFLAPMMLAGVRPDTEVQKRTAGMMTLAGIAPAHQDDISRAFEACIIGSALVMVSRPPMPVRGGPKRLDPEDTLRTTLSLLLQHLADRIPAKEKKTRAPAGRRARPTKASS